MRQLIAIAALLLGGCSSVRHTIEPERILPGPSEEVSLAGIDKSCDLNGKPTVDKTDSNGLNTKSIQTEIQSFITARYCAEVGPPIHAYRQLPENPTQGQRSAWETGQRAWDVKQQADWELQRNKWQRRFVERGVALSMRTCSLFFDTLEKRRVETGYAQTNMNTGGTAVTALLALGGAHARGVFNVATALTLGNAWFENYKSNYVMTPNLGKLHAKLKSELQEPLAAELTAKAKIGYETFDLALGEVYEFDQTCSHKSIVVLLDRAIEAAEITRVSTGPTPSDLAQAEAIKAALFKTVDGKTGGTFTREQFALLYVLATTPDGERVDASTAAVALVDDLGSQMKGLGLNQERVPAGTIAQFLAVDKLLGLEGSLEIAAARKLVAEQVKAAKSAGSAAGADKSKPLTLPAVEGEAERKAALPKALRAGAGQPVNSSGRTQFGYTVK